MRTLRVVSLMLLAAGCATRGPEHTFRESTRAFADGDIERGCSYFSARLLASRPPKTLERYYWEPERRKAVAYLLRDHRLHIIEVAPRHAVAEVTWTTGKTETVYFVREDGEWKLDLPPDPPQAAAPGGPAALASER